MYTPGSVGWDTSGVLTEELGGGVLLLPPAELWEPAGVLQAVRENTRTRAVSRAKNLRFMNRVSSFTDKSNL